MRYILLTAILLPAMAIAQTAPKVDPKEAKCLATTIYGEARGESVKGMIAVGYTAVNRAVNARICDVVLAPKQYSIYNDNPALRAAAMSLKIAPKQNNAIDMISWKQATDLSIAILRKDIPDPTNGATHYLNPPLVKQMGYEMPEWIQTFDRTVIIEQHHFYRFSQKKYDRFMAKKAAAEKALKEKLEKLAQESGAS